MAVNVSKASKHFADEFIGALVNTSWGPNVEMYKPKGAEGVALVTFSGSPKRAAPISEVDTQRDIKALRRDYDPATRTIEAAIKPHKGDWQFFC